MVALLIDKTPKSTRSKIPKKKNRKNDEDTSEDDFALTEDLASSDSESCSAKLVSKPSTSRDSDSDPLETEQKIGEFVVAKFPTAKRDRLFVGKIEGLSGCEYTINTLRKKGILEKGYFVYPEITDLSLISRDQIVRKLHLKSEKRGKFVFGMDNDEFKQLE